MGSTEYVSYVLSSLAKQGVSTIVVVRRSCIHRMVSLKTRVVLYVRCAGCWQSVILDRGDAEGE